MKKLNLVMAVIFSILGSVTVFADKNKFDKAVAYPDGYRSWMHVKSMIIEPGHPLESPFQGIHHIYANDKAVEGYKIGRFPNGSVIVFDLLNYESSDHTIVEGGRKLVGVMKKDDKAFKETKGWGFQAFRGDSMSERLVTDGGESCLACHMAKKDSDFVFSRIRK